MKIYNVRIGSPILPEKIKSFTSKNEALDFYLSYHPAHIKELNERDTLESGYFKKVILEVI